MNITTWNFPTSIRVGIGAIATLPEVCRELGIHRPLVVTDQGLASIAFVGDIVALCNDSGLPAELYAGVRGNPVGANVDDGVRAFKAGDHDGIVAVGGGSALDVAKAVALMGRQSQKLWPMGGDEFDWGHIADVDVVPWIAVPTTAGTGSEVGRSAVIIHEDSHSKRIVFHPALMAPVVISDPQLTCGLPPHITAATGIDAFVHCFEAYCAPEYHPMAEGIALEGMRLVGVALPRAYDDGNDLEARGWMLTAASMGATAFQKGLGGVHAIAHPVGALYDTHHGLANAILLPYVMVANREAIAQRMKLLGRVLDLDDPSFDGVLQWVLQFRERLGIPHTLKEAGVPDDGIEEIGRQAALDPCAPGNPIPFSARQYGAIFASALNGTLAS
jgi:alcohol dehydrogenase class IV